MSGDVLPVGRVTFVFTDIEGSTKLVQELGPDRWMRVLEDHNAILRAAFAAHSGIELKTEGDAFFVVFSEASDAVLACLDGELAIGQHDWQGHPVRVRIGMHTGEATVVGHDYIGLAVHEAARVAGSAHGGQVVISDGTAGEVRDDLPAGVTLRDLGRHALKDLIGPRQLFQLTHPGLGATFPPLRTLSATEHNVPTPPTALIGRDREREEAGALLLGDVRLVTLTGPGGVGKTRLALEVAHDMRAYCSGGVWFVPLAGVRDPAGLLPAISAALGVRDQASGVLSALHKKLGAGPTLLVLDNLEQVLDAAPEIADLIAALPRLKVLATSRERLRLRGERVLSVPPLGVGLMSPAAELFVERADAVGVPVDAADAEAVAQVVGALDGLPLAIELAAARLPDVGLAGLVETTSSFLHVLTEGERDLPARQRTLRAALSWSHDLLDDREKVVFARLAVFAGNIPAGAVEPVCGAGAQAALIVLGSKSLLQTDGERFLMLEPIRQLAAEHLAEAGELERCAQAHADWFVGFAEDADPQLLGADQAAWLLRVADQHDNFRVALDHGIGHGDVELRLAGALGRYWYVRGHWTEGRIAIDRALHGRPGDPSTRAKALVEAGALAIAQSDLAAAASILSEASEAAQVAGDQVLLGRAENGLAEVARQRGDLDAARSHLAHARLLAGEDVALLASVAINEGLVALADGDLAAAATAMDSAVARNAAMGNLRGEALAILNRGRIAHLAGDLAGAEDRYEASLLTLTELGERAGAAAALENLAEVLLEREDPARALSVAEQHLQVRRRLADQVGEARALWQMGGCSQALDHHEAALAWIESGLRVAQDDDGLAARFHALRVGSLVGLNRLSDAAAASLAAAELVAVSNPAASDYLRKQARDLDAQAAGAEAPTA